MLTSRPRSCGIRSHAELLSRVDKDLNCIKGGGGCHLREKVLAEAADTWVIVADYRKNSDVLGTNVRSVLKVVSGTR